MSKKIIRAIDNIETLCYNMNNMTDNVTEMLTEKETLALLKISRTSLWRLRKAGRISYKEFPTRRYRYSRDEVQRILQNGF